MDVHRLASSQNGPRPVLGHLDPAEQVRLCARLAEQFVILGARGAARSYLQFAVDVAEQVSPEYLPGLYMQMGWLLYQSSEWTDALRVYEKGWDLVGAFDCADSARVLNGIGLQWYAMGQWTEAERIYRQASAVQGGGVGKYYARSNLAVLQGERGYYDDALAQDLGLVDELRHIDELSFAVVWSNILYKSALLNRHELFERAADTVEDIIAKPEFKPLRFSVDDSLIVYALNNNSIDTAFDVLARLERAVLMDSSVLVNAKDAWYIVRQAACLRSAGEAKVAATKLERALREASWDAVTKSIAHYELALSARQSGDKELSAKSARAAWRAFRKLGYNPDEIARRKAVLEKGAELRAAVLPPQGEALSGFIGNSTPVVALRQLLYKISGRDTTILLTGESGTGKTMLARLIHLQSRRQQAQFVRFDCTCNDEGLIESLLFGHERGAFTGAIQTRRGLLDLAEKGTLFIDEVGELSLTMQSKLLTLLEERVYRPVGASRVKFANVRFVVGTNRDLRRAVIEKQFREDLFYRLGRMEVVVPPLRARIQDLPLLIAGFLDDLQREYKERKHIRPETIVALQRYRWPGNVRELRNAVERGYVLSEGPEIKREDMGMEDSLESSRPEIRTLEEVERDYILGILNLMNGNKSRAAKMLGIKRTTLYSRLEVLGVGDAVG